MSKVKPKAGKRHLYKVEKKKQEVGVFRPCLLCGLHTIPSSRVALCHECLPQEEKKVSESKGTIAIVYTDHRGETSTRRITPTRIWFGRTEWHPEEQWLLDAFDLDKQVCRSFAMRDIKAWDRKSEK